MKSLFFLIFALTAMCGCTSNSQEYFRERGSALSRTLLKELKSIKTREEFIDRQEKIALCFHELNKLAREVKDYLKNKPETEIPLFTRQNQDLSDELQSEINRLLRQEGCRDVLNRLMLQS